MLAGLHACMLANTGSRRRRPRTAESRAAKRFSSGRRGPVHGGDPGAGRRRLMGRVADAGDIESPPPAAGGEGAERGNLMALLVVVTPRLVRRAPGLSLIRLLLRCGLLLGLLVSLLGWRFLLTRTLSGILFLLIGSTCHLFATLLHAVYGAVCCSCGTEVPPTRKSIIERVERPQSVGCSSPRRSMQSQQTRSRGPIAPLGSTVELFGELPTCQLDRSQRSPGQDTRR